MGEALCSREPAVWLPCIAARVASFLPRNLVACTLRLVDKATSELFSDARILQLSQPAPSWAYGKLWESPEFLERLTLQQRRELVQLFAASGDVANLEMAIQSAGCAVNASVLEAAAAAGALESCQHLLSVRSVLLGKRPGVLCGAAKGGHRAVCEWALANGAERSWAAVAAAYSGGHTDLAEMLKPAAWEYCNSNKGDMLAGAAEGCSLDVLRDMWAAWGKRLSGSKQLKCRILSAAVGSPTPDWEAKAEFLLARGFSLDAGSADSVVHLPPDTAPQRLEWMRLRGWAPDRYYPQWSPGAVSFRTVEWLLNNGAPAAPLLSYWDPTVAPLDRVQALIRSERIQPTQIVRRVLQAGARGFVLLRCLVDEYGIRVIRGAEPGLNAAHAAAVGGCAEAMALLRSHGWSFDSRAWTHAARSGCEAALEWLDQRGCPKPHHHLPYTEAAHHGDARTLRALRRLGLPWNTSSSALDIFIDAVLYGVDLATLRWMAAEGCHVMYGEAKRVAEVRLQEGELLEEGLLTWLEEGAAEIRRQFHTR